MQTKQSTLDLGHLTFLGLIRSLVHISGPVSAMGTLIRDAIQTAEQFESVDYPSFETLIASMEEATSQFSRIEGSSRHLGNGIIGLPACPFAPVMKEYVGHFNENPQGFTELVTELNKSGRTSDKYKIGLGSAVSPFCALHQPMRSVVGQGVTVGGKSITVYQLGCKTGGGKKGFADKWIETGGFSREAVDQALDNHMCCYGIRINE